MIFTQKFIQNAIIVACAIAIGFFFWKWELKNWENQYFSWSLSVFQSDKIEEVKQMLVEKYYHFSEKKKEEIEDGMVAAMVQSLGDKHSNYFPPKEAKDFDEVLRWDFEWIGAVIDATSRGIALRKVFPSSPAEKAWLVTGDILTHVWDESMIGLSTEEAVKKIRWPKWSKVTLTYLHGEKYEVKKTDAIRDTIIIPSTYEKILTWGTIGYMEVAFFGEHTEREFATSLKNLTNSWAKAIILDFRNNGGGYLDSAVGLLSFLLDPGSTAVITRENDPTKTEKYTTTEVVWWERKVPIVMIINNLSASATEIVAWALQDYSRAVIIGEKSYGKWSVQTPFILSDGSMLKITTGRWYTPKDRSIDKSAITPDILVPLTEKDIFGWYDRQLEWAKKIIERLMKWESVETIKKDTKELLTTP